MNYLNETDLSASSLPCNELKKVIIIICNFKILQADAAESGCSIKNCKS